MESTAKSSLITSTFHLKSTTGLDALTEMGRILKELNAQGTAPIKWGAIGNKVCLTFDNEDHHSVMEFYLARRIQFHLYEGVPPHIARCYKTQLD